MKTLTLTELANELTPEQIRDLQGEAAIAGDMATVRMCIRARTGNVRALRAVARIIRNARNAE